jgi:hypothetical protein
VQAGVLGLADAVFDPGVSAVAGFEERDLPTRGTLTFAVTTCSRSCKTRLGVR